MSSAADRLDIDNLLFLFRRQVSIGPSDQQLAQGCDGVQRGAEFVGEIGQKAGLEVRNPAQIIRILIKFRIQGNDAAVCVLQFAIEFGELILFLRSSARVFSSSWF